MTDEETTCGQKRRHGSRKAARRARNATETDRRLHIYRCPFCGWLHLGHLPQGVRNGDGDKAAYIARARQ